MVECVLYPGVMGLRGGCGLRVAKSPLLLGLAWGESSPWARNGGPPPLTLPACPAHLVGGHKGGPSLPHFRHILK